MSTEQVRWSTRIALAKQRGYFKQHDINDAAWYKLFDALDEQCERSEDGKPVDSVLDETYLDFMLAIKANDFATARDALNKIEQRTHALNTGASIIMSNYPAGVTDADTYFDDDPEGKCEESCCVVESEEEQEAE